MEAIGKQKAAKCLMYKYDPTLFQPYKYTPRVLKRVTMSCIAPSHDSEQALDFFERFRIDSFRFDQA